MRWILTWPCPNGPINYSNIPTIPSFFFHYMFHYIEMVGLLAEMATPIRSIRWRGIRWNPNGWFFNCFNFTRISNASACWSHWTTLPFCNYIQRKIWHESSIVKRFFGRGKLVKNHFGIPIYICKVRALTLIAISKRVIFFLFLFSLVVAIIWNIPDTFQEYNFLWSLVYFYMFFFCHICCVKHEINCNDGHVWIIGMFSVHVFQTKKEGRRVKTKNKCFHCISFAFLVFNGNKIVKRNEKNVPNTWEFMHFRIDGIFHHTVTGHTTVGKRNEIRIDNV